MKILILILFFINFLISCTSDDIVTKEREEFYGIFKTLAKKNFSDASLSTTPVSIKKTNRWLSKFNQPIILVTSGDHRNQATLIALGNNEEKLTWVSADGISLTYDQGVLIATRGYSQDLYALAYAKPTNLFSQKQTKYKKLHRYLDGENKYFDVTFQCIGTKIPSKKIEVLDYSLAVDKFTEDCKSERYTYKNEYDLLAGTTIVIVSKQWISPANRSFITYNMYAFQDM